MTPEEEKEIEKEELARAYRRAWLRCLLLAIFPAAWMVYSGAPWWLIRYAYLPFIALHPETSLFDKFVGAVNAYCFSAMVLFLLDLAWVWIKFFLYKMSED